MILDKMRGRSSRRGVATTPPPAGATRASAPPPATTPAEAARKLMMARRPEGPQMVAGPSHGGIMDQGQSWGAWINMRSQGQLELYIRWEGQSTPRVFLYDHQGTPHQVEINAIDNGHRKSFDLPLGFTYMAVQNIGASPQSIRVTTKIPGFTPPVPVGIPTAA